MPGALLRDRLLALQAAEAGVRFLGQAERAAEIRDEVHLLRLDGRPGLAGAIFDLWRKAARVRLYGGFAERLGDQLLGAFERTAQIRLGRSFPKHDAAPRWERR